MIPAFPKPSQRQARNWPLKVLPDGREICNLRTRKGVIEYNQRKHTMWQRQKGICCLSLFCPQCPSELLLEEATFEHEAGRAGGKRDDRVWIVVDGKKRRLNGVAHAFCNVWKGSRRIQYNSQEEGG